MTFYSLLGSLKSKPEFGRSLLKTRCSKTVVRFESLSKRRFDEVLGKVAQLLVFSCNGKILNLKARK